MMSAQPCGTISLAFREILPDAVALGIVLCRSGDFRSLREQRREAAEVFDWLFRQAG